MTDRGDHSPTDVDHVVAEPDPDKGGRGNHPWSRFLRELPGVIIVAFALAILIKTFLVQAFFIPSPSMLPTLEIDDRVLVSKLAYRLHGPEHGDLVVFDSPVLTDERPETLWERAVRNVLEGVGVRTGRVEDLIKRVIAVGGDRLEIRNNQVWVNGTAIDEPYLEPGYHMADLAPLYVPVDHVWVMGDNRDNSQDSRRFGPVPTDEVIGRAFVRIWPITRWDGL